MARKNRLFAKLASDVDTSGNLTASGIQSAALDTGVTVYATRASLPTSGNTAGDQAYVTGNNRLYIWNGSGWYNIALLNVAPSIQSVLDSGGGTTPFSLAIDGTATTITITAADSDGDPITYEYTADSDFGGLATLSQADNIFTITPFSQDSATTTSGTITFTATDGVNTATSGIQTFTLTFLSSYWDEVLFSVGTSSTSGLKNNTYIDRSSNSHSITLTGTASRDAHYQSAFHPYLDNWSVYFDGKGGTSGSGISFGNDAALNLGTGDFTIELWANLTSNAGVLLDWRANQTNGLNPMISYTGTEFTYYVNGTAQITGTSSPARYQWHHVALVRNSGTTTLYVDGVSDGSFSDSTNYVVGLARVGQNAFTGGADADGYISNVRVVKGTAVYTSTFTPPTEKLTAISGTVLLTCQDNRYKDNSTNDWTVTASHNPVVSPFNPFGQGSEYDVGENKGSLYKLNATNWNISALSSNLDLSGDFTIEMWWYPDIDPSSGPPANQYIMDFGSSPRLSIWWSWNDSRSIDYAFWAYTNNYQTFSSSANQIYPDNAWTHLAFVRTISDSTVRLYANGVFQGATQVIFAGNPTSNTFNLGNPNGGNSAIPNYWSDVKITPSAKYSSNFTPPTSPLGNTNAGLYFPFDNAGFFDKTGQVTIDGTPSNGGTNTSSNTNGVTPKYDNTNIYMPGTNHMVQTSEVPPISNIWTLEAWVYPTTTPDGNGDCLLGYGYANGIYGGFCLVHSTAAQNNYGFYATSNGSSWNLLSAFDTGITPWSNSWKHIAITQDGTTLRIFLDGTLTASTSLSATIVASDSKFHFGGGLDGTGAMHTTLHIEGWQVLYGTAKYTSNFTPPTQTQGRLYQAES